MIDLESAADYRLVPQDAMRKLQVEGKIMPLRNQKRIFRGEDEAFLEEASAVTAFPRQKSDFREDKSTTGRMEYGLRTIQRIANNYISYGSEGDPPSQGEGGEDIGNGRYGMGWSLLDGVLNQEGYLSLEEVEYTTVFGFTTVTINRLLDDIEPSQGTPSGLDGIDRKNNERGGYLYPWRRDMGFPSGVVEIGGFFKKDNDAYSSQSAIYNELWQTFYDEECAADDEEDAAKTSLYSAYRTESARLNDAYSELDSQNSQRYRADDQARQEREARLHETRTAAQALRDSRIAEIRADNRGDKDHRIQEARGICDRTISRERYYCYKATQDAYLARIDWYDAAYDDLRRQGRENSATLESGLLEAAKARCLRKVTAGKTFCRAVLQRCPYLYGYGGTIYSLAGYVQWLNYVLPALQSYMFDEARCYSTERRFLPFRWPVLESVHADIDMMRFNATWANARKLVRLPFRVSTRESYTYYGTVFDRTVHDVWHPTLGNLFGGAYSLNGEELGLEGFNNDQQDSTSIVTGGRHFCVRIGNRYTTGHIRSVRAVFSTLKWVTKSEPRQQGSGRDSYEGHVMRWQVVDLTKERTVSRDECERIDAIHDQYFDALVALYRDHRDDDDYYARRRALTQAETSEVNAIVQARTAEITALKNQYDTRLDALKDTLSAALRAATEASDPATRKSMMEAACNTYASDSATLMEDFLAEDIWTVDTEGRELWGADVDAIPVQSNERGARFTYRSEFEECVFLLVEYDFGTNTGLGRSTYEAKVERQVANFWAFLNPQ